MDEGSAFGPGILSDIIDRLTALAAEQNLAQRAEVTCIAWCTNEAEELPYALTELRVVFHSCNLTFRSTLLSYPYITTRLGLFRGDQEVGHYRLITLLDETVDGDYLVFK